MQDLQNTASRAVQESFVPVDEALFCDASSAACPSHRHNLFPGFLHQRQFRFLLKLILLRAHHAALFLDFGEYFIQEGLDLIPIDASRFQRFAWHYYAHSDIASDEFADALFHDTAAIHATSCAAPSAHQKEEN